MLTAAFPGAEGAGANALGGRGGDVYYVTNLNDSGAGSLRDAISTATGPRTVLFKVSGTIHLLSNLDINKSYITIAGQTAPGDGITLADRMTRIVNVHDVVVRHIRFRVGDTYTRAVDSTYEPDSLWVPGCTDVIVDHVSASWSVDETLSVTHGSTNVSIQNSIISESLVNAGHSKGAHGYGSLINGGFISYHHNLYAHHSSRNPRPGSWNGGTLDFDFRNNVVYDWGFNAGYNGSEVGRVNMNYVGNYFVAGPSSTVATRAWLSGTTETHIYQSGNKIDSDKDTLRDGTDTGWAMFSGTHIQETAAYNYAAVTTQTADAAYASVLANSGSRQWGRDAVDLRIVNDVTNLTGGLIDSQTQVGAWPTLLSTSPPLDTDNDGMPNNWELGHGSNPAVADNNGDLNGDGYTNLENYLNALAENPAVATNAAPTVATPAAAGTVVKNGNDFFVNSTGANGAYTSVQAALDAAPSGTAAKRTRIFISPGTYTQQVTISKPYVSLIGTGATPIATAMTFNLGSVSGNWNASTTVTSAATDFIASNISFVNTLGDNMGQALAMHSSADRCTFVNCRFMGYQDTLLVDNNSRQYFKSCYIEGDTDFIYGNATAVFDRCTINSNGSQYITAAETSPTTANGLVFLDCTLTTTGAANNSTYLGRPWHWDQGKIPSVIFVRTKMGPHIIAAGWSPWSTTNTTPDVNTRYSEYGSMDLNGNLLTLNGSGVPNGRVSWADPMTAAHAANYTLANIFGPASFWNATTQPEITGQTYVDQGAAWDPNAALSALNYGPGFSVPLSVLGADDGGEANLTYTWAATTKPATAPAPTFSANASNAAKNTIANNLVPGTYVFTVSITDALGFTTTSSVTVNVVLNSLTGTLNADVIRFERSGTNLNIYLNYLGAPLYTVPFATQGAIAIDALAAADVIEVIGTSAAGTTSFSSGAISFEGLSLTYSNNESVRYNGLLGRDTLTVNSGPAVNITATQELAALNIANSASVVLEANGSRVIDTNSLNLNTSGTLDLTNNALIVHTTGAKTALSAKVKLAQNGVDANGLVNWSGTGIKSSFARSSNVASLMNLYGIGVIRNGDLNDLLGVGNSYTTFKGRTVSAEDVLVRFTYNGDANLDGSITFGDYVQIDTAYAGVLPSRGWVSGDFDYDGTIAFSDYVLIDTAYAFQGAALASGSVSASPVSSGISASPSRGAASLISANVAKQHTKIAKRV